MGTESVDVVVGVACEDDSGELSFAPFELTSVGTLIVGGGSQTSTIDLDIKPGQDASCNEILGFVEFEETSFFADPFIDWDFSCGDALDDFPSSYDGNTHTCASNDGVSSPEFVYVDVWALDGAETGTDSMTIRFTLYAEAVQ
jgi:hypothetical protein